MCYVKYGGGVVLDYVSMVVVKGQVRLGYVRFPHVDFGNVGLL
jgi:hypothetical protein